MILLIVRQFLSVELIGLNLAGYRLGFFSQPDDRRLRVVSLNDDLMALAWLVLLLYSRYVSIDAARRRVVLDSLPPWLVAVESPNVVHKNLFLIVSVHLHGRSRLQASDVRVDLVSLSLQLIIVPVLHA